MAQNGTPLSTYKRDDLKECNCHNLGCSKYSEKRRPQHEAAASRREVKTKRRSHHCCDIDAATLRWDSGYQSQTVYSYGTHRHRRGPAGMFVYYVRVFTLQSVAFCACQVYLVLALTRWFQYRTSALKVVGGSTRHICSELPCYLLRQSPNWCCPGCYYLANVLAPEVWISLAEHGELLLYQQPSVEQHSSIMIRAGQHKPPA